MYLSLICYVQCLKYIFLIENDYFDFYSFNFFLKCW